MPTKLFDVLRKLNTFGESLKAIPESPERDTAFSGFAEILIDFSEFIAEKIEGNHATPTTVNVEVEKNTKGFNYKAVVVGAESVERALEMVDQAQSGLQYKYGSDEVRAFKVSLRQALLNMAQSAADNSELSPDSKYEISVLLLSIESLLE